MDFTINSFQFVDGVAGQCSAGWAEATLRMGADSAISDFAE